MEAAKKLDTTISFGGDIVDCIKSPDMPMLRVMKGVKMTIDLLISADGKEFLTLNIPHDKHAIVCMFADCKFKPLLGLRG